jgi:uncharacterized protein (TIGR03437 family)
MLDIFPPVEGFSGALNPALINVPYSYSGMFRWAKTVVLASGTLPPGLSVIGAGTISGIPTQAGVFNFSLTATGGGGDTLTCWYSIAVGAPITLSLQPSFTLTAGQRATVQWTMTGGAAPFQVKVSGQPDGMMLDYTTNTALIGTPTTAGTYNVVIAVSDVAYDRQQASTTIIVTAPLEIGTLAASARNNNPFTASLAASGGAPPYSWRISSGSLPAGLSLNSTGQISGLVTAPPGSYPFTAMVTDAHAGTASRSLNITVTGPVIAPQTLPNAQAGAPYNQTVKSSGGIPPNTWSIVSGALPGGVALDRTNGTISGSPEAAGQFSFSIKVADSFASFSTAALNITVDPAALALPAQTTASGNAGAPYQFSLAAIGGVTPYQFSIESGTLPDGLVLLPAGQITGTPLRTGTWTFGVRVTDAAQRTTSQTVSIQILGPIPKISNSALVNAASFRAGLAPGEYFSIFGTNLASDAGVAQALPLPRTIGNVTVQWNGIPLPLLAVSPTQINAQIPVTAAAGTAELRVVSNGVVSDPITARVQDAAPGLFELSPGILLAINEDGTLNSVTHPAAPGSVVVFYATGCGSYDVSLPTGESVPADRLYRLALAHSLDIGGTSADILFAGGAPGLGTGLVQINVRVPAIGNGEWPTQLTVAGASSNTPHMFISTPPTAAHAAK